MYGSAIKHIMAVFLAGLALSLGYLPVDSLIIKNLLIFLVVLISAGGFYSYLLIKQRRLQFLALFYVIDGLVMTGLFFAVVVLTSDHQSVNIISDIASSFLWSPFAILSYGVYTGALPAYLLLPICLFILEISFKGLLPKKTDQEMESLLS